MLYFPTQSNWFRFNEYFDLIADHSAWEHMAYTRTGRVTLPARDKFITPKYGLLPKPSNFPLHKSQGVYLIALAQEVIYVGRASGSESIWSRLGKHRIKLTGSMYGQGVHHPKRWQDFVVQRYTENTNLICNDVRNNFHFSFYQISTSSAPKISTKVYQALEAEIFFKVEAAQKQAPKLNTPGHIKGPYSTLEVGFTPPPDGYPIF